MNMKTKKQKPTTIVHQLQQAIADSGQTVYAVAKGADVDRALLGRFVAGQRGISLTTAAKLATYFNLQLRKVGE